MQSRLTDEEGRKLQMMRRLAALRAETRASLGVFSTESRYFADPMLDPVDFGGSYFTAQDFAARRHRVAMNLHDQSSRSASSERRALISPAVSPGKTTLEQVWKEGTDFRQQRAVIIAPNFESSPEAVRVPPAPMNAPHEFTATVVRALSRSLQQSVATQTPDVSVDVITENVQGGDIPDSTGSNNFQLEVVESPPPFMKAFQAALEQKSITDDPPAASTSIPVPTAPIHNSVERHHQPSLAELRQRAQSSMNTFAERQVFRAHSESKDFPKKPARTPSIERRDPPSARRCTFSERLEIQSRASEVSKRAQESAAARVSTFSPSDRENLAQKKSPQQRKRLSRAPSREPPRREPACRILNFPSTEPPHPAPVKSIRTALPVGPRLDDRLRPVPVVKSKPTQREVERAKAAAEAIRQERYKQLHHAEIVHEHRLRERDAQLERQRRERARCEEALKQIHSKSNLDVSFCSSGGEASPVFRVQL